MGKIKSFLKKENGALGIDIGTASIKIVQLRKEKERAILETYGELAMGPYNKMKVGQTVKLPEELAVQALTDVLKEANAKAKTAVVSIPMSASFISNISFPLELGSEISEVVKMEARRYVPVPISEVVLDWQIIPGEEEKKNTRVLLVATHKNIINERKNIVSRAGLDVSACEVECFGLKRALLSRETSPVAILDIGASTTKLIITDYGLIKAAHSIGHGSHELTIALSRSLNVDFARAEEMKREIGLSDLPENTEVVSVFEPVLEYIFSEVNKFIKDFQKKNNRSLCKVILGGGGSLLKGLVDFAVKRFTIEVEQADPFSKTEYPAFLSGAVKGAGANFSTAVGLALRGL